METTIGELTKNLNHNELLTLQNPMYGLDRWGNELTVFTVTKENDNAFSLDLGLKDDLPYFVVITNPNFVLSTERQSNHAHPNPFSLLNTRGSQYGNAWRLTTEAASYIFSNSTVSDPVKKLLKTGHLYNWITILCKLIRLLANPNHKDSWDDIVGYATLSSKLCENPNYQGEL